ncbi:MAG: DUF1292 domain-containing protein [Selenomonadaceae bacterium]|nr:DUF1292 domain-containing protein [Selenomonadaceae bacterium]
MADKRNEENFDDDILIEMTDEEGNVYYYVEEMIIPVGDENFALLIEVKDDEHEHEAGCDCGCEDDDVIIAKIVVNENGQEEYVEPTDEEFERVQAAYEKLLDEEE